MAIVKCPECGREVSDRAEACPGCGFPIRSDIDERESQEDQATARVAFAEFLAKSKELSDGVRSRGISSSEAEENRNKIRMSLAEGRTPKVVTALDALFADWRRTREATREQARVDFASHVQALLEGVGRAGRGEISQEDYLAFSAEQSKKAEEGRSSEYLEMYYLAGIEANDAADERREESARGLEEALRVQGELLEIRKKQDE